MPECPGSCNRRARERAALYKVATTEHREAMARYEELLKLLADGDRVPDPPAAPEKPELRAWPGDPIWCEKCTSKISLALAEIDEDASALANLPPGIKAASNSRRENIKVSGSHAPRSASAAGDDVDYAEWFLTGWEMAYREFKGYGSPPPRGVMSSRITASVNWLGARAGVILQVPEFAEPFGHGVLVLHGQLKAAANAAAEYQHVTDPCPKCKRYLLFQKAGQPYIECRYQPERGERCGLILTRAELDSRLGKTG